jgi:thymidylate synthase (FAD)
MKVELLAHTPEPEKVIATAAKLCYSSSDISTLQDNLTEDKITKFIDMLMSLGHESPVEHVSFTFGIEGISRACSHQLVRHRIASYSQKSQRYVSENQFEYITPTAIENVPSAKSKYDELMNYIQSEYNTIRDELINYHISEGYDKKVAEKMANEDARYVLPNACETKIIVTMNIRSLFNFFRHRCCLRAQEEIRILANEMLKLCLQKAPHIFANAGPSCIANGKCPEGKMTCGKYNEMKEFYNKMKNNL